MDTSPPIQPYQQHITVALHHLVTVIDEYADAWLRNRFNITFNQYHAIAVLFDEEPTDVTGLAHCLGVSKAAVSKRLPALAAAGYLSTAADPHHARRVVITLTDQGRRIVEEAAPQLDGMFRDLLAETGINIGALHADLATMISTLETKIATERTTP
ncbi:MarR family winged helix-turn-helix transcriptional regulator [Jonesia quinghaiensis]|uniref:MarR family winged helix-turn-helix transcriptional regulator n=1 Tax=Jonesia quinghaiensis TaxID=262806 RepID=UPI00040771D9|nr:MarR family transcriptional regulator [Jonesia quinghaiensis]